MLSLLRVGQNYYSTTNYMGNCECKTYKMLYLPHKPFAPLTLPSSPNCFHGMLSGFGHNLLDLSLIIQHEIRTNFCEYA